MHLGCILAVASVLGPSPARAQSARSADDVQTGWDGVTNYLESRDSDSGRPQSSPSFPERTFLGSASPPRPAAVLRQSTAVPEPRFRLRRAEEPAGSRALSLFDGLKLPTLFTSAIPSLEPGRARDLARREFDRRVLGGAGGGAPVEGSDPEPARRRSSLEGGLDGRIPRAPSYEAARISIPGAAGASAESEAGPSGRFYVGLRSPAGEEPLAFLERAGGELNRAAGFRIEKPLGWRPTGKGSELVVLGSAPSARLAELRGLSFVLSVDAAPEPDVRDAPNSGAEEPRSADRLPSSRTVLWLLFPNAALLLHWLIGWPA